MENEMSEKKERIEDWLDRALDNGLCYGNTECRCKFLEAISTIKSLRAELTASRDREEKVAEALRLLANMQVKGHALKDRLQFSTEGRAILATITEALAAYESSRAEKREKHESI